MASFCLVPGGCRLPGAVVGFRDGNTISETIDTVPSGADRRITEESGKQEDAVSGQHCSAEYQGQAGSAPPPRFGVCDPRTSQRRPEGFTAKGRWEATGTGRTCALDIFCPVTRRTPILLGTQGTEQEGQAWRWEQLSAGESGC